MSGARWVRVQVGDDHSEEEAKGGRVDSLGEGHRRNKSRKAPGQVPPSLEALVVWKPCHQVGEEWAGERVGREKKKGKGRGERKGEGGEERGSGERGGRREKGGGTVQ